MPKEAEETQIEEPQNKTEIPDELKPEKARFPWLALCAAIFFDLIGMIPIINILSEAFAGLAFGFWQKLYAPKTNPIITFIVAKIADALCLGFLPSNIAIVIFAYAKKKIEEKKKQLSKLAKTRLGKYAVEKLS